MATLVFFIEILAALLAACLLVGYGTIRNLLGELCGLVLDVIKTARSFSRTSSSLASKLEQDMVKEQQKPAPAPAPKPASDTGSGVYVDDHTII